MIIYRCQFNSNPNHPVLLAAVVVAELRHSHPVVVAAAVGEDRLPSRRQAAAAVAAQVNSIHRSSRRSIHGSNGSIHHPTAVVVAAVVAPVLQSTKGSKSER